MISAYKSPDRGSVFFKKTSRLSGDDFFISYAVNFYQIITHYALRITH